MMKKKPVSNLQNLPNNPWELTDHFDYRGSAWDIVYQNGKGNKKNNQF